VTPLLQLLLVVALYFWFVVAWRRGLAAWIFFGPALVVATVILLRVVFETSIESDETEHLNLAYLLDRGLLPFRDLRQNHSPLLWILISPVLAALPESPYVLLLFRSAALLCVFGCVWVAADLVRLGAQNTSWGAAASALLILAIAVPAELFRVRPDPFMTLLALGSLALLLRQGEEHRGRVFLAGALQGLAMAFTPKVAHLVVLAPVALFAFRMERPGRLLAAYGLGLSLSLLPVLGWIVANGLLDDVWRDVALRNVEYTLSRYVSPNFDAVGRSEFHSFLTPSRIANIGPVMVLACWSAWRSLSGGSRGSGSSGEDGEVPARRIIVMAWAMWMAVWVVAPNYSSYHVAGGLVLSGVLGAWALEEIFLALAPRWRPLALTVVIALCLWGASFGAVSGRFRGGGTYPLQDVAKLQEAIASRGGLCLCVMPYHPIFLTEESPILIAHDSASERMQEAIDWALLHKPGVVTMPHSFALAVDRGEVTREGEAAILRLLSDEYTLERKGRLRLWVRKAASLRNEARREALFRDIPEPRVDGALLRSEGDPRRRVEYARDVALPNARDEMRVRAPS